MSDGQSIRFGYVVHVVGRNEKASPRHIVYDKRRISRDVLAHVPGYRAGVCVVTTACRGTDDYPDSLAFVEGVLSRCRGCEQKQNQRYGSHQTSENSGHNPSLKPWPTASARVFISIFLSTALLDPVPS